MSDEIEMDREIRIADMLLDRAKYYHNESVRGQDEVSLEQLEVMINNSYVAYCLLKYSHPDYSVDNRQLEIAEHAINEYNIPGKNNE